ncbi:hypothetical protein IFT69_18140 [Pseudomonas putida]|nr:hypothetical protein [Pseudomonas putida]
MMKDHEIRQMAKTEKWPSALVAPSGFARQVALVIDEAIELESGEHMEFDSVSFHLVDALTDIQQWGERAIAHFNVLLPRYTLPRSLKRVVDLGPANAHVFAKQGASLIGMDYVCTTCGLEAKGRHTANFFAPIDLFIPGNAQDRLRIKTICQAQSFSALAL